MKNYLGSIHFNQDNVMDWSKAVLEGKMEKLGLRITKLHWDYLHLGRTGKEGTLFVLQMQVVNNFNDSLAFFYDDPTPEEFVNFQDLFLGFWKEDVERQTNRSV